MSILRRTLRRIIRTSGAPIRAWVRSIVEDVVLNEPRVIGRRTKLHISPKARPNNFTANVNCGHIHIHDYVFFGKNVSLLTGSHDITKFGSERVNSTTGKSNDIVIEEGVWVATNAIILGPCRIGHHAVVAAGAVVTHDVPPYTVVGGIPAREIRVIPHEPAAHENLPEHS